MSILDATLLGILQGISEFIPISSSGHLVVARYLLGVTDIPVLFDVILHIATLIVVVFVFRSRIGRMLASLLRWATRRAFAEDAIDLRLAVLVLIATVITAAIGLFVAELSLERFPRLVAGLFIVTGVILYLSRHFHGSLGYDQLGYRHAVIMGVAQGFAVLPGISRSGITISAALGAGVDRSRAGELSFLISIPAVLGALLLTLRDLGELRAVIAPAALAAGFAASLLVGFGSLILLLRLVRSGRLHLFAFYLVPLGIMGLIFF